MDSEIVIAGIIVDAVVTDIQASFGGDFTEHDIANYMEGLKHQVYQTFNLSIANKVVTNNNQRTKS